jgi:hypothetical protein
MGEPPDEVLLPIVESASRALETPVEELPPLSEAVSVDGLAAIVDADESHDVTVTFAYAGLRVLVHSGRTVYVTPIRDRSAGHAGDASVRGR